MHVLHGYTYMCACVSQWLHLSNRWFVADVEHTETGSSLSFDDVSSDLHGSTIKCEVTNTVGTSIEQTTLDVYCECLQSVVQCHPLSNIMCLLLQIT